MITFGDFMDLVKNANYSQIVVHYTAEDGEYRHSVIGPSGYDKSLNARPITKIEFFQNPWSQNIYLK